MNHVEKMSVGVLVLAFMLMSACKPETPIEPSSSFGDFAIHLDNKVALQELYLVGEESTEYAYDNQEGVAFNVSQLDYLISDIELIAEDGTVFKEASSSIKGIHVIQESDIHSMKIEIENVPVAKYVSVRFNVSILKEFWFLQENIGGVDESLNDYFENEDLGFAGLLMKGHVEHDDGIPYIISVSGWENLDQAHLDNTRTVEIDFGWNVEVSSNTEPIAHLNFDVIKLLGDVDFTLEQAFATPISTEIFANRLQSAFSLEHVHE